MALRFHDQAAAYAGSVSAQSWFVLHSAPRMFAHSFRGSTIKSLLGFEDDSKAFARYRAIRQEERAYI